MAGLVQDCLADSGVRSALLADLLRTLGEASALLRLIPPDDDRRTGAQASFDRIQAALIEIRLLQGVGRADPGSGMFREWLDVATIEGFDLVGAPSVWPLAASERREADEYPSEPQRDLD